MTLVAREIIDEQVRLLTPREKWELAADLFAELTGSQGDSIEPPSWHGDVLEERTARMMANNSDWAELEDVMGRLLKKH
jgi:hypothetical protein